jgi:hypothetical protein
VRPCASGRAAAQKVGEGRACCRHSIVGTMTRSETLFNVCSASRRFRWERWLWQAVDKRTRCYGQRAMGVVRRGELEGARPKVLTIGAVHGPRCELGQVFTVLVVTDGRVSATNTSRLFTGHSEAYRALADVYGTGRPMSHTWEMGATQTMDNTVRSGPICRWPVLIPPSQGRKHCPRALSRPPLQSGLSACQLRWR